MRNLQPSLDALSLSFLTCFAQLLALAISDDNDVLETDENLPTLADTSGKVKEALKAISVVIGIYQRVLEVGESGLDKEEREFFYFLSDVNGTSEKLEGNK